MNPSIIQNLERRPGKTPLRVGQWNFDIKSGKPISFTSPSFMYYTYKNKDIPLTCFNPFWKNCETETIIYRNKSLALYWKKKKLKKVTKTLMRRNLSREKGTIKTHTKERKKGQTYFPLFQYYYGPVWKRCKRLSRSNSLGNASRVSTHI